MANSDQLKRIRAFSDELIADPVRLKKFLRAVVGPPIVTIVGKERDQIILLLQMMEPFKETNNQHSWTYYYMIGETEYHVTYFPESDEPIIDKMLPDDYDESQV